MILAQPVVQAGGIPGAGNGKQTRLLQPLIPCNKALHAEGHVPLIVGLPLVEYPVPHKEGLRRGLGVEGYSEVNPIRRHGSGEQRGILPVDPVHQRANLIRNRAVNL